MKVTNENLITITDIPEPVTPGIRLNVVSIKKEMKRLGVNKASYLDFVKGIK